MRIDDICVDGLDGMLRAVICYGMYGNIVLFRCNLEILKKRPPGGGLDVIEFA